MSRERPPGRPPGWARSPGTLRSFGGAFPFRGAPPPEAPPPPGGGRSPLREAIDRLEIPIRITVLLVVLAPIVDLLPLFMPPLWDEPEWRLSTAAALSAALLLPTVGGLLLALLAATGVAEPRSDIRPGAIRSDAPRRDPARRRATAPFAAQALATTGVLALLAGLAAGILAGELLAEAELHPRAQAALVWDVIRALLLTLANAVMAAALLRRRRPGTPVLPLIPPPRGGIDLLD